MKNIAFIRASNIYDDSRASKEISALLENGYKVFVLGWNRDGFAEERTKHIFKNSNVESFFYNVPAKDGIGLRNITKLLKFFIWVYKILTKLNDIDAVHSCNLETGIGAYFFCKKNNVKMVYDVYDYYIDSHSIPKFLINFVERLEIAVINFSKVTIICTEERKEQIAKASPQKVVVLHNSPDVDDLPEEKKEYDYVYCGTLGDKRLVKEILEGYADNSDLKFCFAGYGEFSSLAEKKDIECSNFTFKGSIPYAEVIDIEKKGACLAAIYEPSIRNHRLCAPNKFYEALALAKPVIVCKGTGIDKIVQENDIGFVIDYDSIQFYEAVRKVKENPTKAKEMGCRAREIYEKKYKWSEMKKRMIDMYKDLV